METVSFSDGSSSRNTASWPWICSTKRRTDVVDRLAAEETLDAAGIGTSLRRMSYSRARS